MAVECEIRLLGALLRQPPRYGINAAAVPVGQGSHPYLRITDIDDTGQFAPRPRVEVQHPRASDYRLTLGDLVFARTGASVGKSYLYDPSDGDLVYAGFLISVEPDPKVLNPRYLAAYVQSRPYWDWVASTSMRSGQPGINGQEYAKLPIPLPNIQVQSAIAAVATDADIQIATVERLIAKKEAIKQGMVHELLTGRKRLPGFTETWSTRELGHLGIFLKGHGIKRDDVRAAGVACIRYGELYTTYRIYTSATISFVTSSVAATALPLRHGDLLFAGSGETRDEIGTCVAFTGTQEAVAGGDIIVLRAPDIDPVYLASLINTPKISEQKARLGQGDAVVHISNRALASIEVDLPQRDEQEAIARVLVDADSEIRCLEARLTKAKTIKQGMMQELLTGRTRLPVAEMVPA
jgi:type I restriction enzyme, S subunit